MREASIWNMLLPSLFRAMDWIFSHADDMNASATEVGPRFVEDSFPAIFATTFYHPYFCLLLLWMNFFSLFSWMSSLTSTYPLLLAFVRIRVWDPGAASISQNHAIHLRACIIFFVNVFDFFNSITWHDYSITLTYSFCSFCFS